MVFQILVVEFFFRAAILLLGLLVVGLRRRDDPKVMFGVLEIAFRHHDVAGGLCVTAQLQVFVGNSLRRTPDLHVGSVALIHSAQRIAPASAAAAPAAASAAMAVAVPVLVSGSHRSSIILTWSRVASTCSLTAEEVQRQPVCKSAQKASVFKFYPLVTEGFRHRRDPRRAPAISPPVLTSTGLTAPRGAMPQRRSRHQYKGQKAFPTRM